MAQNPYSGLGGGQPRPNMMSGGGQVPMGGTSPIAGSGQQQMGRGMGHMNMPAMGGFGYQGVRPGGVGGDVMSSAGPGGLGGGPRFGGGGIPGQYGSGGAMTTGLQGVGVVRPTGALGAPGGNAGAALRMPVSPSSGGAAPPNVSLPAAGGGGSMGVSSAAGSLPGGESTDGQQQDGGQQQQQKEVNTSTVCRIGQETVEEIVSRTQEVFSILKQLQPPVGNFSMQGQQADRNTQEKQARLQEVLKGIGLLFKRLRVCWDKCQESTATMDSTSLQGLIPLKDDPELSRTELEKKRGDAYKAALEEHNDLIQSIILKNRHLKDIIDQMRNIIWEINTMLAMRQAPHQSLGHQWTSPNPVM